VFGISTGAIALLALTFLVFLGVTERVLDRMRLTDTQAILILLALVAGSFIPAVPLTPQFALDLGGAVVPAAVGIYIIATAGTGKERLRGMLAALLTGFVLFVIDRATTPEPGMRPMLINIDPVWMPAVVAAIIAYLFGRSRRAAFAAGVLGVVIADLGAGMINALAGRPGSMVTIGGAGVLDAVVIAGVLATALAEVFGETYEYLLGGPSMHRPPGLLRGLMQRGRRKGGESHAQAGPQASATQPWATQPWATQRPQAGPPAPTRSARPGLLGRVRSGAIVFGIVLTILVGADAIGMLSWGEGAEGGTYSILDTHGSVVTTIGRQVVRGDQYLTEDNVLYRVFRVKGQQAWAISRGKINVEEEIRRVRGSSLAPGPGAAQTSPSRPQPSRPQPSRPQPSQVQPSQVHPSQVTGPDFYALPFPFSLTPVPKPPVVGIYFTHNDESYITNEGVSNLRSGPGGIHKVGAQFASALAAKGFTVIKADDLHYPHDPGAYRRSRRTLSYLLGSGPSAVFDVHRDATPQPYYAEKVSGQWVTQIRLVVGQQNPNMMVNRGFAVALKNLSDQQHPGLVKGIFFGRGGYNQDMYPTALLLEVGAHTNAEESARRGVSLFADAVAAYFGR